jgi:hypothetical protein
VAFVSSFFEGLSPATLSLRDADVRTHERGFAGAVGGCHTPAAKARFPQPVVHLRKSRIRDGEIG